MYRVVLNQSRQVARMPGRVKHCVLYLFSSKAVIPAKRNDVAFGLSKINGAKFRELSLDFPKLVDWLC